MSISMVIPFFNEREYLPITVGEALKVLPELASDFELILVNDGSVDGSGAIAQRLAQENPCVKVVTLSTNSGLGRALRAGFAAAAKEIIVYTDMDLPFDLSILRDIIPLMAEHDLIHGARVGGRESLLRRIYGGGYNLAIRSLFGTDVDDVNFALKVFRTNLLKDLALASDGSFIDAELYLKTRRMNKRIRRVEVRYQPRIYGESRLANLPNIWRILVELLAERRKLRTWGCS